MVCLFQLQQVQLPIVKEMEIEFKNLLSETEYLHLLQTYHFLESDLKKQTNYYFDTSNGLLRQAKMGLRIRELPNKKEFTLKVPTADEHAFLEITDSLTEYNLHLTLLEQIKAKQSDVLTYLIEHKFPIESLENIGELTTIRAEKKIEPTILLVLDKSTYYGVTDFELEMEVSDSQKDQLFFIQFLKKHNVPKRSAKKKIARMFERKQQITE